MTTRGGRPLQEIVDALSVRLGRPVLVDDVDLRPLAYSIQFGELDAVRTASILGRARARRARATRCSATASATPPSPSGFPAHPAIGMEARVCIPILRGGRRLGFLWLIEDPAGQRRGLAAGARGGVGRGGDPASPRPTRSSTAGAASRS